MNSDYERIVNDLYLFYQVFIVSSYAENQKAEHIRILADKLMRMYTGEFNRLCVAMPPRHSKSSMVTLAYPLWLLFRNPDLKILIVSNGGGLSEKFGILLREYIRDYGALFGVFLSDVKHSSTYIMTEDRDGKLNKGSIRLVGAGGSITGQDADYLIVDDPYNGFDDITPSQLQKKIDWFSTIIEQRVEPHTRLILLHTRWHSKDLQGYLRETSPDLYEFLTFPAIKENGEPLWGERYSIEVLERKRRDMGERLFQSIFQQEPIDATSDFFDLDNINLEKKEITNQRCVRAWDIASSGEKTKNDYTAGIKMYRDGDNAIVTDLVHGRFGNNTKSTIINTAVEDGNNTRIVLETGVAAAGQLLFDEWKHQLKGFDTHRANVSGAGSKVDRATPFKNAVQDGKIYFNLNNVEDQQKILDEMSSFPNGEHDDIVDALAHAYNYLFDNGGKTARLGVVML